MNELIVKDNIRIEDIIYEIRGVQVMLDSDLAKLYGCANGTKTINLAVKRHINKFPERYMFQLREDECKICSRFQIETLNKSSNKRGNNIKYLPYVFTETGVAMLATVLRTPIAEEITIRIMDAFIAMRYYIGDNEYRLSNVETKVIDLDDRIKLLETSFQRLGEKKNTSDIYFNGQIFDAYSHIYKIFSDAKNSLVIVDRYADNVVLDIIKRLNTDVTIITKPNNLLTKQDIEKYNKQYHNLRVVYDNTFHDRYFILDENIVYHCGTSINRIGYKTFSINLIADKDVNGALIN